MRVKNLQNLAGRKARKTATFRLRFISSKPYATLRHTGEDVEKLCKRHRSVVPHTRMFPSLTRARIIRVARPIHAELCNLHTRHMEIHVFRARARNCKSAYFILHRSSMIQLSRSAGRRFKLNINRLRRITIKCKYKI